MEHSTDQGRTGDGWCCCELEQGIVEATITGFSRWLRPLNGQDREPLSMGNGTVGFSLRRRLKGLG